MLHWNDLHPYNVIEMVRLPGVPKVEHLRGVIHATLKQRGLTGFLLDAERKTFAYTGEDVACEFHVLEGNGNLMVEIERQLNAPFALRGSFSRFDSSSCQRLIRSCSALSIFMSSPIRRQSSC